MTVPTKLEEWTFEAVRELVEQGVFETDRFDFKESLPHSKDDASKHRLRKTVAAFANTDGGFLVFGVKDDRGLSTDDRLVGLEKTYELPRDFGNYPAYCEPSVEWEPKNPAIEIPDKDKIIHIIRIHSSWRKPHSVRDDVQFIFPKRTNKGNEDMSYTEVRQVFQETEFRRTKLALLLSEVEAVEMLARGILETVSEDDVSPKTPASWNTRYLTTLLEMTLGDVFSFLSADRELWMQMLKVRSAAASSNSQCEAFARIVYLAMGGKEQITKQHHSAIRKYAGTICNAAAKVKPKLEKLLK